MKSSEKIPNKTAIRISNAIDFIEGNLDKKLVLEEIAEKAYFSPYHFHRLFKAVTKETVNDFITRKKIEKAASFLLNKKSKTVTEVSAIVGFASLSSFSRAFKKFYGMSPAEFKKGSSSKYSKICKTENKKGKIETRFEQYICNIQTNLKWMQMKAKIEVKKIPTLKVAYLTHQGKLDAVEKTYHKLIKWAYPKGLMQQENLRMLTVYHDSPKITDEDKIRMSVCLILNSEVKTEGEVSVKEIPEAKCIVSRLEITPSEFQQAWESSFVWMSEHGFKKNDQDPYEIFYNNPNEHPERKCIVDICIPVE